MQVTKEYKAKPDDPYLFGEKAQLEFDIGTLEKNNAYASKLSNEFHCYTNYESDGLGAFLPDD